jgi:hypothetical protein
MRGKRKDLPTTFEAMEQHLLDAWARVKDGKPENKQLIELAKKGKLKVNASSVAKEAGVSRTLIGYDGCRYMNVRRKILGEELPVRVPTDMRTINSDLRKHNQMLEASLKLALSENAAIISRMQKLGTQYDDKLEEIKRINGRAARNPNEVVGLHIVKPN